MAQNKSIFTLNDPCSNCPFRSDKPFYLDAERAQQIADELESPQGATFYCHKTIDYDKQYECEDDEQADDMDRNGIVAKSRACAGALITMEKSNYQTLPMRIAVWAGIYDPSRLNMDAPVFGSLREWVASMKRHFDTPPSGHDQ